MKKLKNFIENNYIRMNYVCLCLVISVSLAIGFFLYGPSIVFLIDFFGMIIVFIVYLLNITFVVYVVSMFSKTISYLILVVFFACTTKYTINKIEISEID